MERNIKILKVIGESLEIFSLIGLYLMIREIITFEKQSLLLFFILFGIGAGLHILSIQIKKRREWHELDESARSELRRREEEVYLKYSRIIMPLQTLIPILSMIVVLILIIMKEVGKIEG